MPSSDERTTRNALPAGHERIHSLYRSFLFGNERCRWDLFKGIESEKSSHKYDAFTQALYSVRFCLARLSNFDINVMEGDFSRVTYQMASTNSLPLK